MEKEVKVLADKLGVKLIAAELEAHAYYIPKLSIIVYRQGMHELDEHLVLMHELAHAAMHKDMTAVYKQSHARLKIEHEANRFMIEHEAEPVIDEIGVERFDVLNFVDSFKWPNRTIRAQAIDIVSGLVDKKMKGGETA